ncbi:unnamed protein product [Cunninghamella echinulata]
MDTLTIELVTQYISIGGSIIDQIGKEGTPINLPSIILRIELLKKKEVPKKSQREELKKLIQELIKTYGQPTTWEKPIDLGLGCLKESRKNRSYFRVIYWPFGQKLRKHLGLNPTYFHITIGFNPSDIHSYKGPATLKGLKSKRKPISTERLTMLSHIAKDYTHDIEFLEHLLRLCKLNDMEILADSWRHYVMEADKRFTSIKKKRNRSEDKKVNGDISIQTK